MTAILSKSSDRINNQILLPSIRWETYRAIADDLEAQPSKRLTYDNGLLELKSTLKENALIRQVREWAAKLPSS